MMKNVSESELPFVPNKIVLFHKTIIRFVKGEQIVFVDDWLFDNFNKIKLGGYCIYEYDDPCFSSSGKFRIMPINVFITNHDQKVKISGDGKISRYEFLTIKRHYTEYGHIIDNHMTIRMPKNLVKDFIKSKLEN